MYLVDHGKGYFLIICQNADELRALALKARLHIATRNTLSDGRILLHPRLDTLHTVARCRSYSEYEAYGGGEVHQIRLVPHYGVTSAEAEFQRVAAVCTPGWVRRQKQPRWRVGLSLQHLRGHDLPPYAKTLIQISQKGGKWASHTIALS